MYVNQIMFFIQQIEKNCLFFVEIRVLISRTIVVSNFSCYFLNGVTVMLVKFTNYMDGEQVTIVQNGKENQSSLSMNQNGKVGIYLASL